MQIYRVEGYLKKDNDIYVSTNWKKTSCKIVHIAWRSYYIVSLEEHLSVSIISRVVE